MSGAVWLGLMGGVAAQGVSVVVDYSNDDQTDQFFTRQPTARAAMEAAVATVNSLINIALGAVENDIVVGTHGSTTATFNWSFTYRLPSTGATRTVQLATVPANTVTLFVGVRELFGADAAQAAPGGMGLQLSGNGYGSEWQAAVAAGETASRSLYNRGGPFIGQVSGTSYLDGWPATYSVPYSLALASAWFDADTNDDGLTDTLEEMEAFWHFDHTTAPDPNKLDFFSVAAHEVMHGLGMGSGLTWSSLIDGTNWLGEALAAENGGSGQGLVDPDGKHLSSSLMSPRLSDGVMQMPLLSSTFSTGERREMTRMDLAVMRDVGWVQSVPEPHVGLSLLLGAAAMAARRRRPLP